MISQPELGNRLAELRRQAGLSQTDLAGEGVSASYVSLLEAGKRVPTNAVIQTLAERLGCSVEYLRDGVEPADRERVAIELRFAELARLSGDPEEARQRFAALLDDASLRERDERAEALLGLARSLEALDRLEEALDRFEELRRLADDDPRVETWWSAVLGLTRIHGEIGDSAYSVQIGEAALRRAREHGLLGTDLGVKLAVTLAGAYSERGDIGRARLLLTETTRLAEQSGSPVARGSAYWNASIVAYENGRYGEAIFLADRALALYAEGDDERAQARLRMARGWLTLRISPPQPDEALGQLRMARERLLEVGTALDVANCDTEIARARLLMGAPAEAVQVALGALARMREGDRLDRARTRVVIAAAQLALGNDAAANQAYEGAAADLARAGANRQAASAWLELAEICEAMGRSAEALAAYRKASAAAGLRAAPAMPLVAAISTADASGEPAEDVAYDDHYVDH